jgi:nickel-dependent lactate racemase
MALGSHRPPTDSESRKIFGNNYDRYREWIEIHDAQSRLLFLGKTRRSTPIWLNQEVLQAQKLLVITSVEPHYFAGFTGGRKSFLPGVAGYETITCNHRWAVEPQARTLALKGNPVHEDMVEAAGMVSKECFSIQVVVDGDNRIRAAFAGDIQKAFMAAVKAAQKIFCIPIPEPADIVVSLVQPPYDINFYQAQKALQNAWLGLKEGGILIFASQCREGVGDDAFLKIMADAGSPQRTIEQVRKDFVLGYQKSAKLAEILLSCKIFGVAGVEDETLKQAFIKPFNDVNDALDEALQEKGKDAKVLILKNGSLTIPMVGS